ncbi:glycosyltransferase family 4 protein [Bacteroides stercorirosoris]|uniref:Glycosyltransferase n=1 Tax=Bacteroides stercorirosoris TaxID=871324 RepID=A0A413H282_9BACE|nr:glycosyltransferase family 4 protein [Bacteroides stercorirosoris]RGX77560.1 glycosyltransferase [Bacteroides stercorirosoris]
MNRIICFHLFNDYSGSPKVLKMVLEGLLKKGCQVDLVSSKGGALDELLHYKNLRKHSYPYRFSNNPVITMLRYSTVQIYTFLLAFRWLFHKDVVFYINTLLPIGSALAGRIMGKHVVYHYHENAFVKGTFYKGLATAMQKLAHEIICVSEYQASFLQREKGVMVVPNALPKNFVNRLTPNLQTAFERKQILMLGSLKLYKSPLEFIELAQSLPQFIFVLVINDTKENIDIFIEEHKINVCKNLTIYPRQNDVVPFYNQASLVLNLSNKKQFVETFGLTALEAMSAGMPVIVPTEGGIAEMVADGENGYKIDVQNLNLIAECIKTILSDETLYMELAKNAFSYSKRFSEVEMVNRIETILDKE